MSDDRFSRLTTQEQRAYMAQAIGCNPNCPEGWPDRIINDLVAIRLRDGTRAYYEQLGYLLGLQ